MSDNEVAFTVDDGASLEFAVVPRLVTEVTTYLDALVFGRLLTGDRLAADMRRLPATLAIAGRHPAARLYRTVAAYQGRRHILYGSKQTIAAYREKHNE